MGRGQLIGLLDYVKSFFTTVTHFEDGKVTLMIRGVTFQGHSWTNVREKVRSEAERMRRQLADDSALATRMMPTTNQLGRINVGVVRMKGTLVQLEAYEKFLGRE
jgi:hypothetical protein